MTDFFDLIDQGYFKKPRNKKEAEKKRLLKKQEEAELKEAEQILALQAAVTEMARWQPTAKVCLFYEVHCTSCGERTTIPEIHTQGWPLIRFVHKRDGTVWEKRVNPDYAPGGLPRVGRILPGSIHACPQCIDRLDQIEDHRSEHQLALDFTLMTQEFPHEPH